MRRWLAFLGIVALLGATPQALAGAPEAGISDADAAALQLAVDRGQKLHDYDQAAWHTTDALLEDVKDPAATGIGGWVVTENPDGWLVTFWKPEGEGYSGVYSALWTGREVTDRRLLKGDGTRLSDEQLRLIVAEKAIDPSGLGRCSDKPFNTVAFPEGGGGTVLVYLLTPQGALSSVPMGGHYRFTVEGGKVVDQRAFTKSCLDLNFASTNGKGAPAALVVTHLLDPVPTEIHVFSVFAANLPIFVTTTSNQRLWSVEVSGGQARIRWEKK